MKYGTFCELYGKTLRNRVLEYLLKMKDLDFATSDMATELEISKPKMYQLVQELKQQKFVRKTRIIAGTQLYILNRENHQVKLLQKAFRDCLQLVTKKAIVTKTC